MWEAATSTVALLSDSGDEWDYCVGWYRALMEPLCVGCAHTALGRCQSTTCFVGALTNSRRDSRGCAACLMRTGLDACMLAVLPTSMLQLLPSWCYL